MLRRGYSVYWLYQLHNDIASLENRQWITVTATVKVEFQMAYKKKGPVLYVEKVEPAEPPVEEMVYF